MTDEAYTNVRQNLTARARDLTNAAWKEATTWDAFKWTLIALLAANFLLVALLYGGIRSEIADLKEDRGALIWRPSRRDRQADDGYEGRAHASHVRHAVGLS